jgi:hypothetical protein
MLPGCLCRIRYGGPVADKRLEPRSRVVVDRGDCMGPVPDCMASVDDGNSPQMQCTLSETPLHVVACGHEARRSQAARLGQDP